MPQQNTQNLKQTLYCNGYLEKLSGGRDKMWALTDEAKEMRKQILENISEVKGYWS